MHIAVIDCHISVITDRVRPHSFGIFFVRICYALKISAIYNHSSAFAVHYCCRCIICTVVYSCSPARLIIYSRASANSASLKSSVFYCKGTVIADRTITRSVSGIN